MQSTANIENVSISIPITDLSFLRTLSKKMGWTIKRQRKSRIDRALDDIKAGRVYEARSVDDLFEQLEKWNTGSECQGELPPPDTDLIYFPADMQENGSVTLNPTGFLFGFRKTIRWRSFSLIQEHIQTYFNWIAGMNRRDRLIGPKEWTDVPFHMHTELLALEGRHNHRIGH